MVRKRLCQTKSFRIHPPQSKPHRNPPLNPSAKCSQQFEHSHSHKVEGGARQLEGIVVSVDAESVYLDIGFKAEGILPRTAFENNAEGVTPEINFLSR